MPGAASESRDARTETAPDPGLSIDSRFARVLISGVFLVSCLAVWVQVAGVADLLMPWPVVLPGTFTLALLGLIISGAALIRCGMVPRPTDQPSRQGALGELASESVAEGEGWRERVLVGVVGLILFGVVMATGAVHLRHQRRQMRALGQSDLEAIANLKIAQFEGWRGERMGDALFFSQAAFVAADARAFVADPASAKVRARLLNWLTLLKGGDRYATVAYYDAASALRLHVPPSTNGLPERRPEISAPMFREGAVLMSDLADVPTGGLKLDIMAPVLGENGEGGGPGPDRWGYLLLTIDPEQLLFPMLRSWPVTSATAEVLLVRREGDSVRFLCQRGSTKAAAAPMRFPIATGSKIPAVYAVTSGAGFHEASDYRGVPVIAVTRPVPGTPWHLIVKKDRAEAYSALRSQSWLTLGLLGVWIAATILGLRYFSERRARRADRQRLVLAERMAHLMNQANDPILLLDERGQVMEANRRALQSYGYAREEMAGCRWTDLGGGALAVRRGSERSEVASTAPGLIEELHRRKDGSTFPVECSLGSVRIGDGWYWQAIVRDITDRKRQEAERREFESRLRHQQKLEAIGTLASGVAHEINNPITGVLNYAQLILDHPGSGGPVTEFAAEIIRETGRVAAIVRGLLQFAHRENQAAGPARLADIVETTLSLVRVLFRKDQIVIELRVPPDLPWVRCRPSEIQQVVMNLLTNARDALNQRFPAFHPEKRITLDGRTVESEGRRWVRLSVVDRGSGVPAEVRERIFEPFFTTKTRDKGTGLGLAISHGLVRENQGLLHFETECGKGTTFHLDLPMIDDGEWQTGAGKKPGSDVA
ncbi:MAG: PAS domain S-box protein [Verrucomicrobiales bacterium]|nr:PAS domain S-box protein [Verrucomicrobiales bacterium]